MSQKTNIENVASLKYRLSKPDTRDEALKELGDWLIETCLLFGTSVPTAYQVAALMTKGIKESYEDQRNRQD